MTVSGRARLGRVTKKLIPTLLPGDIAIIDHADIDRVSADGLARAGVKAVINVAACVTGTFPNAAPQILIDAGIPVVESAGQQVFEQLHDDDQVVIDGADIRHDGQLVASGVRLTQELLDQQVADAQGRMNADLESFALNTVDYIRQGQGDALYNSNPPQLSTQIAGKQVLVVVRGPDFHKDLVTLRSYIGEMHPVIIAVDGGADALIEMGYVPDVIVGDMDSVTDGGLRCGAELVAHAYEDGTCPSAQRLDQLGVSYQVWPLSATSEDLALLLAWEMGADLIVAVGTHTNFIEYMEKNRHGMASTFLVRLRVGTKLVDAKGVSKLYRPAPPGRYVVAVVIAALVAVFAAVFISEPLRNALTVMWLSLVSG